jgi:hypothetical protein
VVHIVNNRLYHPTSISDARTLREWETGGKSRAAYHGDLRPKVKLCYGATSDGRKNGLQIYIRGRKLEETPTLFVGKKSP